MASDTRQWLVIEPLTSGHHSTYLREILRGAAARRIRVILGVAANERGDGTAELVAELPDAAITVVHAAPFDDGIKNPTAIVLALRALRWWLFFRRAYRAARKVGPIDTVFVPYLDHALVAISAIGSPFSDTPFRGIVMFQRFHLPGVGVICGPDRRRAIKKWLFRRFLRLRTLKTAYVIDETLKSYVEQSFSAVAAKVRFMPDPSVPIVKVARESARQMLALPSDACLILVYGSIDVRKDVPTLLAWAASCAGRRQVHVLLAGLVKDDVKQALDSEPAAILEGQGRLWKIPRYIDPHEESAVFSASDIVWLAYDNVESLSGVMVKAALFEKTILFRNYGLMGRYAMQFGSQVADRSSSVIDECTLPPGIELRVFGQNSPVPLPNHSWHNACQLIFDA